jgi:ATP-binding cassette, subfamily B, bacterial PglK
VRRHLDVDGGSQLTEEPSLPRFRTIGVLIPKGHRAKWGVVALMGVATAAAESVAALSIAALIAAMTGTSTAELDLPLVGDITEWLPGSNPTQQLRSLAIAAGLFFIVKGGIDLARMYAQSRVANNTGARLSNRLYQGYLQMPYSSHITRSSSELIRNASWAADEVVATYLMPLATIIVQASLFVMLLAVLVATAPAVTLVTIGILLPTTIVIMTTVRPRLRRLGQVTKRTVKESFTALQQSLHGIRDVKILGREKFFGSVFRNIRQEHARSRYLSNVLGYLPSVAIETLVIVAIIGFILMGSQDGLGTAALPTLGLFAYAGLRMMPATSSIVGAVNKIRYGQSVAATVASEIAEIVGETRSRAKEPAGTIDFNEVLELKGVNFSYDGESPTLQNIDLAIRRGESIGIVGETGAGKSTLLDIILGLLEPNSGTVEVDGLDISGRLRAWHSNIGLVPQTIYILDDTVRRNIAYGLPEELIDEGLLSAAVGLSQLQTFLDTLPDGLDTYVGERGIRLSGGQRQRVAIARALYRRPGVLVFDEGTASLDNLTEAQLLRSIQDLRDQDHTIITVAHRLTTVRNCDRIILLDDGKIADEGTYEELQDRNSMFRQMTS